MAVELRTVISRVRDYDIEKREVEGELQAVDNEIQEKLDDGSGIKQVSHLK